ncbi:hypothetical protein [Allorhizocola rhizosphaerae]|uniref:hypothetical protein n=1 Tax=Allorhizocola rhizosphaerae TaxID=1872709 RepID=UPI000E3E0091|nr:hypothetical protein [Allorhizocola rhizosphaerae]
MGEIVRLGSVTCPSGVLAVLDGGCLGMWSGSRSPSEIDPVDVGIEDEALAANIAGSMDFEVAGPDAERAALSFERRPMRYHYDIPADRIGEWIGLFDEHCRAGGWNATLQPYPRRVAHRERARRCAGERLAGFVFFGLPAVAVGEVPTGESFEVVAERSAGRSHGWKQMVVRTGDRPVVTTRSLGLVGVDTARLAFADVDALDHWEHERPLDGLADVVFWGGPNAEEAAAHFSAPRVGSDGSYGWEDLPARDGWQRAIAIQAWKDERPERKLGLDFRPHSHHWQVMRQVRADDDTESGTIAVGGADITFAMTSWGDGFFPAYADYDGRGGLVAVRIQLAEDRD